MMTLYLVFEALKEGRLRDSDRITMSEYAAGKPPSKLGLAPGESLTVRQAIYALITKSANDVAAAVAEHLGGSEWQFARKMTAKARELGMSKTTFRNASGLTHRAQVTTARDMVTLGLALQDNFPTLYRRFRTRSFAFQGRTYRNHNQLLRSFHGTNGIKTGYTRASGFNLVSSVRRGRKHVVAAVFGGRSGRARNAKMRVLLTRGLAKASTRRTREIKRRPARPMLVARPRPAARPAPRRLAAASVTRPATIRVRSKARPAMALNDRIAIARVRRVPLTGGRSRPSIAAPQPNRTWQPASASTNRPTSISDLIARASLTSPPAPSGPSLFTATGARKPSTLGAQARALDNGLRQTASPRRQSPTRQRASGAAIQVGAYLSEQEARERIADVRRTSGNLLADAQPVTMAVTKGSRQLYRARFAGLDSRTASTTCSQLKARGIDCHVAR